MNFGIRRLSSVLSIVAISVCSFPLSPFTTVAQNLKTRPKYNVLFIISDDLRPELGAYGVKGIKTPNIDKLAARSMRFDRAYAQYPVCNPSRTSLLTGRYPTETKVLNNNDYFRRISPSTVTLPQYFKQNGYVTMRSGKIFHGGIDDPDSWDVGGEPPDPNITERGNPNYKPRPAASNKEDDEKAQSRGSNIKESSSDRIVVLDGNGETSGDYKVATRAIALIEQYKDKPFFLGVGFVKPHSPPTAPKKFFDMYDIDNIPLPVDYGPVPKAPPGLPPISIAPRNSDLFIGRESTPESAREMKRAYWASVSFMDEQVGRVLDALEKNGLKDKTIVVLWGDHGYHLGEKGKWSKGYSLYEVGLRVPLLIAVPNGRPGSTDQIVESLDLYPTLAELCGLPKPSDLSGASLVPRLAKPNGGWDRPAYSVVVYGKSFGRSVRTARWHYVEWDEGRSGSMLFETEKDPPELKNLADDPKYANIVAEMKKLLAKMPVAKN